MIAILGIVLVRRVAKVVVVLFVQIEIRWFADFIRELFPFDARSQAVKVGRSKVVGHFGLDVGLLLDWSPGTPFATGFPFGRLVVFLVLVCRLELGTLRVNDIRWQLSFEQEQRIQLQVLVFSSLKWLAQHVHDSV